MVGMTTAKLKITN